MTTNRCSESFYVAALNMTVTCVRKAAPRDQVCGHDSVCVRCFAAWEMENDHQDGGHKQGAGVDCPSCFTYDPRGHLGHTNTVAKSHTSHAGHDHPATPKARAACRKASRQV